MPANLNALIRYKTINSCLFGGKRRWSIDELRERCSEALAEDRGRYAGVSERTIRDDIRVMRSDILGFSAPIKQEGGFYFYSDPGYSILSLRITDAGLAEQILVLLQKLRGKVNHPEMEIIMEKLSRLIGRRYEPESGLSVRNQVNDEAIKVKAQVIKEELSADEWLSVDTEVRCSLERKPFRIRLRKAVVPPLISPPELVWAEIMAAAII
jgi:predicted DNA-binding transcriptional regulator YafY